MPCNGAKLSFSTFLVFFLHLFLRFTLPIFYDFSPLFLHILRLFLKVLDFPTSPHYPFPLANGWRRPWHQAVFLAARSNRTTFQHRSFFLVGLGEALALSPRQDVRLRLSASAIRCRWRAVGAECKRIILLTSLAVSGRHRLLTAAQPAADSDTIEQVNALACLAWKCSRNFHPLIMTMQIREQVLIQNTHSMGRKPARFEPCCGSGFFARVRIYEFSGRFPPSIIGV